MNQETLKSILELLIIVASNDGLEKSEIENIKVFLNNNLNAELVGYYLNILEKNISKYNKKSKEEDYQNIRKICFQINKTQNINQRFLVILRLAELIYADGIISDQENEYILYISKLLKISIEDTNIIKVFVDPNIPNIISNENILLIDNGENEYKGNKNRLVIPKLGKSKLFVCKINTLNFYLIKYKSNNVNNRFTLNNTKMIMNQVYPMHLGSVVKGNEIKPIFYNDISNAFQDENENEKLSFIAEDISFVFDNGHIGLSGINIQENGRQLVALMGGSGSGKSTLLNVLNGNLTPSQGSVRINKIDIHRQKEQTEGIVGYIPQDDLLIEELTVYQNLYYTAKLCFNNIEDENIKKLTVSTLKSLGLYEARDLKVGNPLDKSISGGQRKRLNIGLELLREPSILFVDEPTSGLSSSDSENVINLLKDLSYKGKLIFVVIHQPSEDIFRLFDKLILLDTGGYQIYYGNPIESITYFKEVANIIDKNTNSNPEQIFHIIEEKFIDEYGNFTDERKYSSKNWNQIFKENVKIEKVDEVDKLPPRSLNIPNRFKQFYIYSIRDFLSKISNKQYLVINFSQAPLLALLLCFFIKYIPENNTEYSFAENVNIPVFFFMSVIVSLFMGLTVSAEEILRDRKILERESFLNLSRASYLVSKTFILFCISNIQVISFILISCFILDIKGMYFTLWLVLISTAFFANITGLNISSAFKSAVTIYVLIPLLIIPQLVLSGVVVNFDMLNPLIKSNSKTPIIADIMASRWAYEALMVSQFKDNKYYSNIFPYEKEFYTTEYTNIYYIPKMTKELDYVNKYIKSKNEEEIKNSKYKLKTLQNEIKKQLKVVGNNNVNIIEELTYEKYNDQTYMKVVKLLEDIKNYYNKLGNTAFSKKGQYLNKFAKDEETRNNFLQLKKDYENKAVVYFVKNTNIENRILEDNNELIQKIYPIFNDPNENSFFNFRAHFYAPTKQFMGTLFDTKFFNVIVILMYAIFTGIALYFDWLKKIVDKISGS